MNQTKRLVTIFLSVSFAALIYAQPNGGISYQAVARTAGGDPIQESDISVRFSIHQDNQDGILIWQEDHDVHTSSLGLFTTVIGGPDAYNQAGEMDSFEDINWSNGPHFLKIWIKTEEEFQDMGGSIIQTVPLARHAQMAKNSAGNFSVTGETGEPGSALFEVKRADGMPVFAVYEDGVWVYSDAETTKGIKGGFAVGGYTRTKGVVEEYMRITPDSARIYINQTPVKGIKGGFAVGGYTRTKGPGDGFLEVTPVSTHVFYDENAVGKGIKGGFAVGGYTRTKDTPSDQLLSLTRQNYFIGHEAGLNISDMGSYNQFIGYQAGMDNTNGRYNVFMGYQAGMHNIMGENNVFIGESSGAHGDAGNGNVYLGNWTGFTNRGDDNVIIGNMAGAGGGIPGEMSDFTDNIMIGSHSGYNNRNGKSNVFIGTRAGFDEVGDLKLYIDNTGTGSNFPLIYGDFIAKEVTINNTLIAEVAGPSDATMKKEIRTLENTLDKVLNLRAVTFEWDQDHPKSATLGDSDQIGMIAQEVEAYFPELVIETAKGYKALSYGKLSAVLLEAIKEQQVMIRQQQEIIDELTTRVEQLEGR